MGGVIAAYHVVRQAAEMLWELCGGADADPSDDPFATAESKVEPFSNSWGWDNDDSKTVPSMGEQEEEEDELPTVEDLRKDIRYLVSHNVRREMRREKPLGQPEPEPANAPGKSVCTSFCFEEVLGD